MNRTGFLCTVVWKNMATYETWFQYFPGLDRYRKRFIKYFHWIKIYFFQNFTSFMFLFFFVHPFLFVSFLSSSHHFILVSYLHLLFESLHPSFYFPIYYISDKGYLLIPNLIWILKPLQGISTCRKNPGPLPHRDIIYHTHQYLDSLSSLKTTAAAESQSDIGQRLSPSFTFYV